MVDISKIKPGDKIRLHALEVFATNGVTQYCLPVNAPSYAETIEVYERAVSEHIPAPREFKVGETVAVDKGANFEWRGVIKCVDGAELFVRSIPSNVPRIVAKKFCSHID